MRKSRIKIQEGCGDAYYHCMSRTVNGEKLFGSREKEVLRKMIHQVANFSGVDVLTFCVMGNHFHVLIRVVEDARKVSDAELVRRYRVLYPTGGRYGMINPDVLDHLLATGGPEGRVLRQQILRRMGDVSEYMKTLKQRFTVYINQNHGRFGTLWAERFKSVLIEPENKAILAVAAYIDLNSVRAGLVEDPKDYRFCGYAEAVAGNRKAKEGLSLTLLGHSSSTLSHYRMVLFGIGSHPDRKGKEMISWEKARAVLEKDQGKLPLAVLLRCRLRYFTDGWVLGSEAYARKWMSGKKRAKPRVVPVSDPGWEDLVAGNRFRGPVCFESGYPCDL